MRQLHIALALLTAGGAATYFATRPVSADASNTTRQGQQTRLTATTDSAAAEFVAEEVVDDFQDRPLFDANGVADIAVRDRRAALSRAIVDTLRDAQITEHRRHLLELAGTIAEKIPVRPQAKDRALTQQVVVEASLELDQALLAHQQAMAIENWRRGLAYAQLAYHAADKGRAPIALEYANSAAVIGDDLVAWLSEYETPQEWRRDRIRGRVGQTHARLGDIDTAAGFVVDAERAEAGKVAITVAAHGSDKDVDERIAYMRATFETLDFDSAKDALTATVALYGRHYQHVERRAAIEEVARLGWSKLPIDLRVWAKAGLAEKAIESGDNKRALEWLAEGRVTSGIGNWRPEFRIQVDSSLAALSFRAGDVQRAVAEADKLRTLYDTRRNEIVNINRADALVPLAEAYTVIGDAEIATALYRRAVDEAMVNPNSKPRAMDLVDIAVSLATGELPPNSELMTALRAAAELLADPW